MTSTIYTIGFTKKSAEEFFRLLQEAQVRRLKVGKQPSPARWWGTAIAQQRGGDR